MNKPRSLTLANGEVVRVGDIFYSSWGYDQTNVDFYEVAEVTSKCFRVREIGCKSIVKEGYSDMSDHVIPDPTRRLSYVDEAHRIEELRLVKPSKSGGLALGRHGLYRHKEGQEHYRSWYA